MRKNTRPMERSPATNRTAGRRRRTVCRRRLALLITAVAAFILGIWLFLAPGLEKQKLLDEQARLMDNIAEGSGVIALDAGALSGDVDFYDEPVTEPLPEPAPAAPPLPADTASEAEPTAPVMDTEPVIVSTEAETTLSADMRNAAEPDAMQGIGILSIEKIGLKLPVVDGVSEAQLKVALGRVPETAEIGAIGNAVIAGHRSYAYGEYFNRLGEIEAGDIIEYTGIAGEVLCFEVYDILTVEPGDQSAFAQTSEDAEITLYTCTPIRIATHRLLVKARQIS